MKTVTVVLSEEAERVYDYLENSGIKVENSILHAVKNKIELIKANFHYGDPIAKKLIPQEYKLRYGITNLFRVELPDFWRMLYTLTAGKDEDEVVAFILDIIDHKTYNKKFGYN